MTIHNQPFLVYATEVNLKKKEKKEKNNILRLVYILCPSLVVWPITFFKYTESYLYLRHLEKNISVICGKGQEVRNE